MNLFKNIKALLPIFLNIYLLILGLTWVSIQIYFRIIVKKHPYVITDFKETITMKILILFIWFVIIHFFITISITLNLYRQYKNKKPSIFILKLSEKTSIFIDYIYWKPLQILHDMIAPHIPGSGRFFLFIDKQWTEKQRETLYFKTLTFMFSVLPKLILVTIFIIEIVILYRLKYFIYFLTLILIPIIFNIFLKLMITFGVSNMPIIKNYFYKIEGENPIRNNKGEIVAYSTYRHWLKPEYSYFTIAEAKEEFDLLLQLESMQSYALQIKEYIDKWNPYITLLTSILYFIGGLFRLYLILF